MTIEAQFIKSTIESKDRTQRLFKISSPVSWRTWDPDFVNEEDCIIKSSNFVIVSRIIAFDHEDWETMIFPADQTGEIIDWGELWSVRGWEHIGTTVNNFVDRLNREAENDKQKRLQAGFNNLD